MTIKDWTDFNYKLLGDAINRITSNDSLSEELLHYTLTAFLERSDAQQIIDAGGGFFFCLRIATNSWKSTTSPFYRLYRDPNPRQPLTEHHIQLHDPDVDPFDTEIPDIHNKIDSLLKELSWYEKELTLAYAAHDCNASALSKVTKIPRTSINLTLNRVRTHIKKTITHE